MDILEFSPRSLGSNLSFVSTLLSTNKPFLVKTLNHDNEGRSWSPPVLLSTLKNIFGIGDNFLIEEVDELSNDLFYQVGDLTKMFSPTIEVNSVHVLGNSYDVGIRKAKFGVRKPCIALGCYSRKMDFDIITDDGYNATYDEFPLLRHYTVETNAKVFAHLLRAGYDVINLDSMTVSLEQKVYIINELCDAVVTYEGGLAHLSHILKVPAIILPWRTEFVERRLEMLHLDKRTYFVNNINDLLGWSKDFLHEIIDSLANENGNNLFFTNPVKWERDLSAVHIFVDGEWYKAETGYTEFETQFIQDNVLPQNGSTFCGKPIEYNEN